MAHTMTAGMLAATKAAMLHPIVFISMEVASATIYLWDGIGSIVWDGHTWLGVGKFLGIGTIGEVNQVQASGVPITLNGVPADMIGIALNEIRRYLPVRIWLGALDTASAIITDPYQIREGRVDSCSISADGKTAKITVTVESRLIIMRRSRERRLTDQDQRIEHPTDDGFKYVDSLQNAAIVWGRS